MVMVAEGGRSMSIEMRVGDGDAPGRCGGFSFPIMILLNSQVSATYKSAGTDLGGGVSINVCPSVVETQLLVAPPAGRHKPPSPKERQIDFFSSARSSRHISIKLFCERNLSLELQFNRIETNTLVGQSSSFIQ